MGAIPVRSSVPRVGSGLGERLSSTEINDTGIREEPGGDGVPSAIGRSG